DLAPDLLRRGRVGPRGAGPQAPRSGRPRGGAHGRDRDRRRPAAKAGRHGGPPRDVHARLLGAAGALVPARLRHRTARSVRYVLCERVMTQETSFPKSEIKILQLENVHPVAAEAFREEGFQVDMVKAALPEAELVARARDVHVLGIRSKTQVTPAVLDAARRMLAVGAFCIGTNQIALRHANRCGVPVFNAPFSNTRSVAE